MGVLSGGPSRGVPAKAISLSHLVCAPADSHAKHLNAQFKEEGNEGSSHWAPLSRTNYLSPPFLPAKGSRGLCRSMAVTFKQVFSLGSGERNSVLPFKLVGREWGNKLNGPHLLQLGRSNGRLPSTINNVHPWISGLIGKKIQISTIVLEFMIK